MTQPFAAFRHLSSIHFNKTEFDILKTFLDHGGKSGKLTAEQSGTMYNQKRLGRIGSRESSAQMMENPAILRGRTQDGQFQENEVGVHASSAHVETVGRD